MATAPDDARARAREQTENIEDAMRAYLSWEIALADQMATDDDQRFKFLLIDDGWGVVGRFAAGCATLPASSVPGRNAPITVIAVSPIDVCHHSKRAASPGRGIVIPSGLLVIAGRFPWLSLPWSIS